MVFMSRVSLAVLCISVGLTYLYYYIMNLPVKMASHGFLLVSNISKLHNSLPKLSPYVKKVLYIKLKDAVDNTLSHHISGFYTKATSQSHLDVRLILKSLDTNTKIKTTHPIDVVLIDNDLCKETDNVKSMIMNLKTEHLTHSIDLQENNMELGTNSPLQKYDHVALGGTFDRLHNGHKILLSQAVLRTKKKLTVGVTDINMIQSKKLWELIEPVEQRVKSVRDFLTDIDPTLQYNVLPIQDIYGPTKDDPTIQLLVVSEETKRGGDKVNEKRKENGLPLLDNYVIDLAEDSHPNRTNEEETKVSSSNQRMRLLGTVLRKPEPNPYIPNWPYVIGLAGGIASGKSNIAKYLQKKGAGLINCDIIGHELYKPGLPLNGTIATTFGKDVITETGEIDRKKLGEIVFSDKGQLEKLNRIMWPAILEEAQLRIQALGKEGCRVVVMEAAVMIRAKWYNYCHQLWSVIIPPEEAVKRLKERNGLSEEEAKKRIAAQPSNAEQVEPANVVFSPYWSYEYTRNQVDRAWNDLQGYLEKRERK